ncbi:iron chelate uptake ABC transporter family permease subunit [Stenoxybacter acetivorans]|uniref:iron chelate uptake ABC transporter family permease subunit n=1 Tax=Stenoxybacter acetivorans TaxID=422441 RepID=UPI00068ACE34|nr:iron chelate uptake ABC transporter family permease subunit [Stenoxybacter acetivorans]
MLPEKRLSDAAFLGLLGAALLIATILFFTINTRGNWDFVLPLRGKKWLLLLTVAYAVGVSTLLFQTLTHNPILTPSLLGFDSLYVLLQTALVFALGSTGFVMLGAVGQFALAAPLMITAAFGLFTVLTRQAHDDLARLVLVGVIFGVLFRSINSLLQRLIDPNQFAVAQTGYFAQFTTVNTTLLIIGMLVMSMSFFGIWRLCRRLDILMLGRETAIGLGVDYRRDSRIILLWVTVLVSVATALVGPVSFFGLLVCAMVNALSPHIHHRLRLPAAVLIAAVILVLGQTIFEQVLGMKAVLGVVIEFLGGLVFLWLVLRRRKI